MSNLIKEGVVYTNMNCPICGHNLSFLTEALAFTRVGTQCPKCWSFLSQGQGTNGHPSLRRPATFDSKAPIHNHPPKQLTRATK